MAEITLHPMWVFKLTQAEALLVLKALGGRLTGPEAEDAKKLGDALTKARASASAEMNEHLQRHASNVKEES